MCVCVCVYIYIYILNYLKYIYKGPRKKKMSNLWALIVFNWNYFEMRLLNLRINFYLLWTFCPHLGSLLGQKRVLYFDLRPGPKMLFQGDTPEGSDTFQVPVIERDHVGGLRLMIWDKVKVPLCH